MQARSKLLKDSGPSKTIHGYAVGLGLVCGGGDKLSIQVACLDNASNEASIETLLEPVVRHHDADDIQLKG